MAHTHNPENAIRASCSLTLFSRLFRSLFSILSRFARSSSPSSSRPFLTVTVVSIFRSGQGGGARPTAAAVRLRALPRSRIRQQEGPEAAQRLRVRQVAALQVPLLRPAGEVPLGRLQARAHATPRDVRDDGGPRRRLERRRSRRITILAREAMSRATVVSPVARNA